MACSPDARYVVTGSTKGVVRVWETESWKRRALWKCSEFPLSYSMALVGISFSPDGKLVFTKGIFDNKARLRDRETGKVMLLLEGHTGRVGNVTYSPDAQIITTCDSNGWVFFWRANGPETGKLLGLYVAPHEVNVVHWQDTRHVVLVDRSGQTGHPLFYYLALEGDW